MFISPFEVFQVFFFLFIFFSQFNASMIMRMDFSETEKNPWVFGRKRCRKGGGVERGSIILKEIPKHLFGPHTLRLTTAGNLPFSSRNFFFSSRSLFPPLFNLPHFLFFCLFLHVKEKKRKRRLKKQKIKRKWHGKEVCFSIPYPWRITFPAE